MEPLVGIGAFARRVGMSVSALRFYGECGLIEPRTVDEATGYRYYADDQLEQAILVRQLRATEMPIEAIRRFLAAPPEGRHQLINEHSLELSSRIDHLKRSVDELRSLLEEQSPLDLGPCGVVPAAELALAIAEVRFAVADDGERPDLSGVLFEAREDALRLVATDSYRLAIREVPAAPGVQGAGVKGLVAPERLDALAAECRRQPPGAMVAITARQEGTLCAELPGVHLELGPRHERYPDYEELLAALPSGEGRLVDRRLLLSALTGSEQSAWLRFERDAVVVDSPTRRCTVPASRSEERRSLLLNPAFVCEALERLGGPDVVVEVTDALRPLVLRSVDSGTLTIWTMPIRPA